MNSCFGPWATAIHGGSTPQLSAFWRRRLARLPALSRNRIALSKSAIAGLLLAALALGALPTLHGPAVSAEAQALVAVAAGDSPLARAPNGAPANYDDKKEHGTVELVVEGRFVTCPAAELAKAGPHWLFLPSASPLDFMSGGAPAVMSDFDDRRVRGTKGGLPNRAQYLIEKNAPVTYGILDETQAAGLLEQVLRNRQASVLQAPKLRLCNEQTALISDTSQTPFVVSLQGDPPQPQIGLVSEGVTVQLRPAMCGDGKVRLDFKIVFAKVQNVDTLDISPSPQAKPVTIQVPEVATTTITGGVDLPVKKWLLLNGPAHADVKSGSGPNRFVMMRVEPITRRQP